VYGWQPKAFTKEELADDKNELAKEAKLKLGDRLNPDYIGVTCEGEVRMYMWLMSCLGMNFADTIKLCGRGST
jgi:hypothetical protein